MYVLFAFDLDGRHFELQCTSWTGEEVLRVDGHPVSARRSFAFDSEHAFALEGMGSLVLRFQIELQAGRVHYELWRGDQPLTKDCCAAGQPKWLERLTPRATEVDGAAPGPTTRPGRGGHWAAWLGLATKLLQGGKAIKLALAGMAVSGWTVMFSLPFALVMVAVLVFHEWGHLRAMRRFGIPTKGMYLIPFVGGMAVGDRPQTRWQEVYIAMMGPVYGLGLSLACFLAYLLTESSFVGLLASIGALVNVFNLLPVHPLDGGRVVKALVFSARSRMAFWVFLAVSVACFVACFGMGLHLLAFFVVIGAIDLMASWNHRIFDRMPVLDRYGILFVSVWYLGTLAAFVAVIWAIASKRLPGSELAVRILAS